MKAGFRYLAALVVVGLMAVPAAGQVTPEDISEAEAELAALREETEELAVRYEAALTRAVLLEDAVAELESATQDSQIELAVTRKLVREHAVEMYMESSTSRMSSLFVKGLEGGIEVALGYLGELGASDTELLRDLEVVKASYERQLADLNVLEAEQEETVAELAGVSAQLNARLEEAQATYVALVAQRAAEERARAEEEARRRAEEEAARRAAEEAARRAAEEAARTTTTTVSTTTTAVPPTTSTVAPTTTVAVTTTTVATTTTTAATTTTSAGATTTTSPFDATTTTAAGATTTTSPLDATTTTTTTTTIPAAPTGQTCPVDGFTTFADTWGAPRSGGRSHQGVDMLGARWTPLVAIESGTILRLRSGGLGGYSIWLTGSGGDEFYYAHLEAWAEGLQAGQSVHVGEVIGYLGTSGNAPDYIPHLHFEFHPGGGAAVNPYPLVKSLCG